MKNNTIDRTRSVYVGNSRTSAYANIFVDSSTGALCYKDTNGVINCVQTSESGAGSNAIVASPLLILDTGWDGAPTQFTISSPDAYFPSFQGPYGNFLGFAVLCNDIRVDASPHVLTITDLTNDPDSGIIPTAQWELPMDFSITTGGAITWNNPVTAQPRNLGLNQAFQGFGSIPMTLEVSADWNPVAITGGTLTIYLLFALPIYTP
jgi:hypothetical protein